MELLQRIKDKLNYRKIASVCSILIPIVIVFLCFTVAKNVEPGKIVPIELTKRLEFFDEDIFAGIDKMTSDSVSDSESIKSGDSLLSGAALENILLENCDPFFVISLILPSFAKSAWFMIVFYLKFGLLGLTMYWLLRRHINLNSSLALILSTGWALAPMFLCVGQIGPFINMAIMLPVVLSGIDGYIRNSSRKSFLLVSAAVAILLGTGIPAMLFGFQFVIYSAFFLTVGLVRKWKKVFAYWGKLILAGLLGALYSAVLWIPRLFFIENNIDFENLFTDGSTKYTFIDQFIKLIPFQAVSLNINYAPNISFGIFALILVFLFFINPRIPARFKATLSVLIVVTHIFNVYTPFSILTGLGDKYSVLVYSRYAPLICLLVFAAAVSLKNIRTLSKYQIYCSGFIGIVLLIMANSPKMDSGMSFLPLYLSGLGIIGTTIFLLSLLENENRKNRCVYLGLALIMFITSALLTITRTAISPNECNYYKPLSADNKEMDFDTDDEFSVFGADQNVPSFVVATSDLSLYLEDMDFDRMLNNFSRAALIGDILNPKDTDLMDIYGFFAESNDEYTADGDDNELVLGTDMGAGEILYVFSSFRGDTGYDLSIDPELLSSEYYNPFLYKISDYQGYCEHNFRVSNYSDATGRICIYSLNQERLDELNAATRKFENSQGVITADIIPGQEGAKTVVTSIPYSASLVLVVNGEKINAFNYCGKTAFSFTWLQGDVNIKLVKSVPGVPSGISLSLASILGTVALIYLAKYNKNKDISRRTANVKHKNS